MTSPISDRWWPALSAARLFAVPPFPESDAGALVTEDRAAEPPSADDVRACLAALGRHRVGGTFWAARPPRPTGMLARPRDLAHYRAMAAHAARTGHRPTYWFPDAATARQAGAVMGNAIVGPCDPWHLLHGAGGLWADPDDEIAPIAAIVGMPRHPIEPEDQRPAQLTAVLAGVRFRDPFSGADVSPVAFVETLGFWRRLIDANRPIAGIHGVAFWKRASVAPLLWDGGDADRFRTAIAPADAAVAAWIARTPAATLAALARSGVPIHQIEDGFIRSVGLGADCVPPLSIVVDPAGAHYDAEQPSGLETMLQRGGFTPDMLDRARRLRALIVARGISKYALGVAPLARPGGDRRHVLVTGQVEDDQSVLKGGGGLTNLDLLRRARAAEPDAYIVYRPHPDVDAGHRRGHIAADVALTLADTIARDAGITALIDMADRVHVLTSLAGFEALLRDTPVTTHGVPFYAGWGLTDDLGPVPARRTARRSLDELVAATLLLYPRYLDPVTGLPCPPEVLIDRIAAGHRRQNTPLVAARRLWGGVTGLVRRARVRR